MLEHADVALPCVVQFTASNTGATGLTVACTVFKWGGASWSTLVSSQAATEVGEGFYSYQLPSANNTGEGLYLFVFGTAGTADLKRIGVGWAVNKAGVEYLDLAVSAAVAAILAKLPAALVSGRIDASVGAVANDALTAAALASSAVTEIQSGLALETSVQLVKAKTDPLTFTTPNRVDASVEGGGGGGGDPLENQVPGNYAGGTAGYALGQIGVIEVAVTSPVLEGDVVELVAGDAYDVDHGRQLDFDLTGAPTLVGASVSFVIHNALQQSGTVLSEGASTQTCRFELTAAQTSLLTKKGKAAYRYQVQASWAADTPTQPAVLASGDVNVVQRFIA